MPASQVGPWRSSPHVQVGSEASRTRAQESAQVDRRRRRRRGVRPLSPKAASSFVKEKELE